MKVTNNHDAPLNVAGVDIRPKATAEVPDDAFKQWSHGHAAKVWVKQKLITTSGGAKVEDPGDQDNLTARQKLEARATEAGVAFTADTSDKDLEAALKEADKRSQLSERETLLEEARSLGLNPNVNTGLDKLRKMIADKKGE